MDPKPGIPRSIAGKIQRKDLKVMAQTLERGGKAKGGVASAGSGGVASAGSGGVASAGSGGVAGADTGASETVKSAVKQNSRSNSNSAVEKLSECSVESTGFKAGKEEEEERKGEGINSFRRN